MSCELGDFTEWTTTATKESTVYVRAYYKVKRRKKPFIQCASCDKTLKANIWYIQINEQIFCSEECARTKYEQLIGPFERRRCKIKMTKTDP